MGCYPLGSGRIFASAVLPKLLLGVVSLTDEDDELTSYMFMILKCAELNLLKFNNEVFNYLLSKLSAFPNLSKVSLGCWLFWHGSSEQAFSFLKLYLSKHNLKDDIVDSKALISVTLMTILINQSILNV